MALSNLPVPGCPTTWMVLGQGPTARAVGADGGCLDIIPQLSFSPLSPTLWETARYRLKYCLKGPITTNQPTNQLGFVNKNIYSKFDPNPSILSQDIGRKPILGINQGPLALLK